MHHIDEVLYNVLVPAFSGNFITYMATIARDIEWDVPEYVFEWHSPGDKVPAGLEQEESTLNVPLGHFCDILKATKNGPHR